MPVGCELGISFSTLYIGVDGILSIGSQHLYGIYGTESLFFTSGYIYN
jgi:hypothetical protein